MPENLTTFVGENYKGTETLCKVIKALRFVSLSKNQQIEPQLFINT